MRMLWKNGNVKFVGMCMIRKKEIQKMESLLELPLNYFQRTGFVLNVGHRNLNLRKYKKSRKEIK